jgi:RNA polymerase sigma-70 factor (ECF subfamily)
LVLTQAVASPADDQQLVRRALAGDRAARRELAGRLLDGIQREVAFCLLRVAGAAGRDARQEVRDLVQDVLVRLFEHDGRELRRWDPDRGRSLDSFVRFVARRRVARVLGQRRGNPFAQPSVDSQQIEQHDDTALVRRLEERQALDQLLVALHARMNERDHELFELLYVDQVTPEEAAERLDMTRGAINAWSYRIRKLARQLAAEDASSVSSDDAPVTMGGQSDG